MTRRRRPSPTPLRRVGIYKVDRLGDFVLALGAIRRIIEHEGAENCVLIISPFAAELANREFPEVLRVVLDGVPVGARALWRYLRNRSREDLFRHGLEKLIYLRHHRPAWENALCAAIPAEKTWGAVDSGKIGLARPWNCLTLNHSCTQFDAESGEPTELSRHRAVVSKYLGRQLSSGEILPSLMPGWRPQGEYVAVTAFGSHSLRDYPSQLLARAGKYLWHTQGLRLCLLSPEEDASKNDKLACQLTLDGVPKVEVRVCPSLEHLIHSIRKSQLVLTVDTATAHLATALDLPMVALLGGGHPGWFGPWNQSARQKWLMNVVPCFNCNWHCFQPEPICLTHIRQDSLLEAIADVFATSSSVL